MNVRRHQRKAISPIVATVLIVAATLIAFAATAGYVFGIFGSGASTANVSVTGTTIAASSFAGGVATAFAAACSATATAPDIALTNTGTASATVTSVSLTVGSASIGTPTAAPTGGALCNVAAGGTVYLNLTYKTGVTGSPASGISYTGSVTLSNGAQATFAGTMA